MSLKELYEALLIEMLKEEAPNILLEDFNYFANKAVQLYINKRYTIYDTSQLTSDDLRVLKSTAVLDVTKFKDPYGIGDTFMDATYEVDLPDDYYHILNCLCFYKVHNPIKCWNEGDVARAKATRLTADMWNNVVDDFWNRPTPRKPYYYIHHSNTQIEVPTNPGVTDKGEYRQAVVNNGLSYSPSEKSIIIKDLISGTVLPDDSSYDIGDIIVLMGEQNLLYIKGTKEMIKGTLWNPYYNKIETELSYNTENTSDPNPYQIFRIITINDKGNNHTKTSEEYKATEDYDDPFKVIDIAGFVKTGNNEIYPQRNAQVRYGNASKPRMEIRYGNDSSVFELFKVGIDYIKTPQYLRLTQELLDRTIDTSQILEFPDYVCLEIVNELVHIVMENNSDLRLLTHPIVTLSIAAQQLTVKQQ